MIEYQWPKDGDEYVPQRTTFIIRPTKSFMQNKTASDFYFFVNGINGSYTGKVVISDDNQTIIYKPDHPFNLNDVVYVNFAVKGAEIPPLSFSFHITSMTELQCGQALYTFHQKDQAEIEAALEANATLPMGNDTVAFTPAVVVIDTVTTHYPGNIFFSPTGVSPSPYSFLAIVSDTASQDPSGGNNLLFERDIPIGCGNFRMQPDGTLTFFRQELKAPIGGIFFGRNEHLDRNMNLIDTFQCVGYIADLHDFQLLPNGHSILIAYDPRFVDMKVYLDTVQSGAYKSLVSQAYSHALVVGAIIQELDQDKNLFFQWRSWDHFQIVDATRDVHLVPANKNDTVIDYMHINAALNDPKDGNILASFRHCDEVAKITRSNGGFLWRWGGKHNQFTFLGDTLRFSHQHDPERIDNGHITMLDNGNLHTKDTVINGKDTIITRPSTRAIEYDLDEVNHTATAVWQYNKLPFCSAAGNVQRLANGNTMIGLGNTTQPSAVEINPANERVFQMSIQKLAFSYRTYRYEFTPPSSVRQTGTASSFGIASIYPNPAQNIANISFSVTKPGLMRIELLDIIGNTARSISEKLSAAGTYSVDLDLHNLASGTYYCKLSQGSNAITKMIIVQK